MNLLSLAVYLHLAYHIAITDLTRVSLPGFTFPLAAAFRHVPRDFLRQCQQRCRYHADEVSNLIEMVQAHGPEAFDDPFCHIAAFEAAKIQIIHAAVVPQVDSSTAERNVKINLSLISQSGLDPTMLHASHMCPPCLNNLTDGVFFGSNALCLHFWSISTPARRQD